MSTNGRRCLFVIAAITWVVWKVAFASSLLADVGPGHLRAMYALLAVAIVVTLVAVTYSAVAPVHAALRALLATNPRCTACEMKAQRLRMIPIVPMKEHSKL